MQTDGQKIDSLTETELVLAGDAIATELGLKINPETMRYDCVNGNKTNLGLARTIIRILAEAKK